MLKITPIYLSLFTILFVFLSFFVIYHRRKSKIALLGLGDEKNLNRAIRMHGNFAEYAPLGLLLLVALELVIPSSSKMLHFLGVLFFLGRCSHAFSLAISSGPHFFRTFGMVSTFTVLLIQAFWLLKIFIGY